jgi:hypothetical protein
MPELAHRRTAVARAARQLKRSPEDTARQDHLSLTRTELAEAKIVDYIARTVAAAPPLSPAQRSRLALLLAPVDADTETTPAMHNREAA